MMVLNNQAAGLTTTAGKSRSTAFSITVENVDENSTWFGWVANAVNSSLLPNVIKNACVNPCLSISWLSISCPLVIKHIKYHDLRLTNNLYIYIYIYAINIKFTIYIQTNQTNDLIVSISEASFSNPLRTSSTTTSSLNFTNTKCLNSAIVDYEAKWVRRTNQYIHTMLRAITTLYHEAKSLLLQDNIWNAIFVQGPMGPKPTSPCISFLNEPLVFLHTSIIQWW